MKYISYNIINTLKIILIDTFKIIFNPILPSKNPSNDLAKLILIASFILTLFLFCSGYVFPGGAVHYTDWAFAITENTKLPLGHAQREVGLPLMYLLSGLTLTKSFIGPTIAYAIFAILIVILNYLAIGNASRIIAFFTSILLILSLAPFSYIKFFYPDQLYIFLIQALLAFLISYIWTNKVIFLYLFTFFAVYASLTRTAGNLLFIFLIFLLFFINSKNIKHYLTCLVVAGIFFGANQYHRYHIFDLANQNETKPVGKGYQILYSTYMWMGDFNYRLKPELGPNTKLLLERMYEELSPSPKESILLRNKFGQTPSEFMENHIYKYSTEQLIEKVLTEPGEEYFFNVIYPIKRIGIAERDTDDEFQFEIVKEIWKGYPLYIIKYGFRNLFLTLFDPGWSNPRYSKDGFIRQGVEFMGSQYGWGVYSADTVDHISENSLREHEFHQFKVLPLVIKDLFLSIKKISDKHFRTYVYITSAIILSGWIIIIFLLLLKFLKYRNSTLNYDRIYLISTSIVIVSVVLIYENTMTALFSQPHFRYFHITESWRFIIVGLTVSLYIELFSSISLQHLKYPVMFHNISSYKSIFNKNLIFSILISLLLILWWTIEIMKNTRGDYQVKYIDSFYSDGINSFPTEITTIESLKNCKLYACKIKLSTDSQVYLYKTNNLYVRYSCKSSKKEIMAKSYHENNSIYIDYNCY